MSNYKKLAKNTFWFSIGSFGSKAISFFMVPIYTSVLSQKDYGFIDLILTTISLVIPILTLQIADATLRFTLNKNYKTSDVFTNSILVITLGGIISLIFYPILNNIPVLNSYLREFYLCLWTGMFFNVLTTFTRAIDKVYLVSLVNIFYTFLFAFFNIYFLVYLKLGIEGYFLSYIIAYTASNIILIIKGRFHKYFVYNSRNRSLMMKMIVYSIPLIPNLLSWWVVNLSDRYIITYYLGLSATGIYTVSSKIPSIISIANSILYQSWQLSAVEEYDSKDRDQFYTKIYNIYFMFIVLISSMVLVFEKLIFKIIAGQNFFVAWEYAPMLIIGVVFSFLSTFFGVSYIVSHKTSGAFYTSVYGAVINLILNIVLIPKFGIQGAAFATMFSYFVMCVLRIRDSRRYFKIKLDYKRNIITIILLGLQAILLFVDNRIISIYSFIILIVIVLINLKSMSSVKGKVIALINRRR
jgi:O-antigen/teichoic acid export membrane protein